MPETRAVSLTPASCIFNTRTRAFLGWSISFTNLFLVCFSPTAFIPALFPSFPRCSCAVQLHFCSSYYLTLQPFRFSKYSSQLRCDATRLAPFKFSRTLLSIQLLQFEFISVTSKWLTPRSLPLQLPYPNHLTMALRLGPRGRTTCHLPLFLLLTPTPQTQTLEE